MKDTPTLTDLPQTMTDAAFDGDRREVLRAAAQWLRRFTNASYTVVVSSTAGKISCAHHSGSAPDYALHLDKLPIGRGSIFLDNTRTPRVVFSDGPRPPKLGDGCAEAHFIGLPMFGSDSVAGMAYVSRPTEHGQYTWREQLCMCNYVSQVAVALEIAEFAKHSSIFKVDDAHEFVESMNEMRSFVPFRQLEVDEALNRTIMELSALANVDAAHVYLPAPGGLLVPTNRWHQTEPRRFAPFLKATERSVFTPGRGLPGRVLASQQSFWIADVSADENFPRITDALPAGIRSAAAFPVRHNNRVTAVVECFFTHPVVASDSTLLRRIESVLAN